MARSNWRDRVEFVVEVGIRGTAAGDMVWDVSSWDSGAEWSDSDPDWQALPGSELESLQCDRGRKSGISRNSAGTASVGLVWRNARGARWSFRPASILSVGSELRVRAIVDGGTSIPVYRGTIRRLRDRWAKSAFRLEVQLVDRLADLGAVDLPEQPVAGLGDLTHQRVARILTLAGIDAAYSVVGVDADSSGVIEHASSNFARNLLDEAYTSVESDAGSDLLVDRDGRITLRRPHWWTGAHPRWNATRATWANVDTDDPLTFDVLEPGGFGTGTDLDDVRNHVSAARVGGTATTVEDGTSEVRYGMRTYQRFDLTCRFDADVVAWADLYLAELSNRTERVDAIASELDPRRSTTDLERYLDVELGDQHGVTWDDGDGELVGTFHVLGIRWRVDPAHVRLELDLWAFEGLGFVPPPALWGSALWGSAQWTTP